MAAKRARDQVQRVLLKIMVRTERLSASSHRSGMLAELPCTGLHLESSDIGRFVGVARLARHLGVYDPMEYWKSAPNLVNYMEKYRLDEEFDRGVVGQHRRPYARPSDRPASVGANRPGFRRVDPENASLRWLLDSTVGQGAWQLWGPPVPPVSLA